MDEKKDLVKSDGNNDDSLYSQDRNSSESFNMFNMLNVLVLWNKEILFYTSASKKK